MMLPNRLFTWLPAIFLSLALATPFSAGADNKPEQTSAREKIKQAKLTKKQSRLQQMRRLYSQSCPDNWKQHEYEVVELERKQRWKGCPKND